MYCNTIKETLIVLNRVDLCVWIVKRIDNGWDILHYNSVYMVLNVYQLNDKD